MCMLPALAAIPLAILVRGKQVEFILQQIAFGVKHSGHAVELVKDLVNRMNDSDIAEMGKLFAARLVGSDPSSEPTPEPVDVPVVTPEVEPVTNAAESVS